VFFWAGMAARHAGDDVTLTTLRAEFRRRVDHVRRNQELQAASVLGITDVLKHLWEQWMGGERGAYVRHGNLALALADAGMIDELKAMLAVFEAEGVDPRREANSNKHFVWALCIAGRFDWALRFLEAVDEPEHWIGAVGRLVSEATKQGNAGALAQAKVLLNRMTGTNDDRIKTRMVPILYRLGDKDTALLLAEDLVREGVEPSATTSVAFPLPDQMQPVRDGAASERSSERGGRGMRRVKSGSRPLQTNIAALADEQVSKDVMALAREGKVAEATARLSSITVPRFRWQALYAIATAAKPGPEAISLWRDALLEARLVNEPSARITAAALAMVVSELTGDTASLDRLTSEARTITKAWTEAALGEQYESLRELLASGAGRTRRLDELITTAVRVLKAGGPTDWITAAFLLPIAAAGKAGSEPMIAPQAHALLWGIQFSLSTLWSVDEVRALINSGRAGKRTFAIALMKSRTDLVTLDALIALIDTSLSAFEQFHALSMALEIAATLDASHRSRLREAIERARLTHVLPDTDRYALSERILAVLSARGDW
jgi:hypothetical protein